MTSGKIDEPIKPQGGLKGVNLESLLESITLLAEDDGRSIEELEAEALAGAGRTLLREKNLIP